MVLILFEEKLTELQQLIPPIRVGTKRSMKASYSVSWKKSPESESNQFHKLYFSQRSTVGSGSSSTAGIVEYDSESDCKKREQSIEDILEEDL